MSSQFLEKRENSRTIPLESRVNTFLMFMYTTPGSGTADMGFPDLRSINSGPLWASRKRDVNDLERNVSDAPDWYRYDGE